MDNTRTFNQKKESVRIDVLLLGIYIILAPFDIAFGNLMGNILNVLMLVLFLSRCYTMMVPKFNTSSIPLTFFLPIIYLIYETISGLYSIPGLIKTTIFPAFAMVAIYPFSFRRFNSAEIKLLRRMIFVGSFVVLAVAIYNLIFHIGGEDRLFINLGQAADPNYFCAGIAFYVLFAVYCFFNKERKILPLMVIVAVLGVCLMTGSRGSLMAVVVSCYVYVIISSHKKFRMFLLVTSVLILGYMLALAVLPSAIGDRLRLEDMLHSTGSGRTVIWSNFLEIFAEGSDFHQVFGFGRGSCFELYIMKTGRTYIPHNMFIKTLIEGGVIGLMLLLVTLLAVGIYAWRKGNKFAVACLIALIVSGIFLDMDDTRTFWFVMTFVFISQLFIEGDKTSIFGVIKRKNAHLGVTPRAVVYSPMGTNINQYKK